MNNINFDFEVIYRHRYFVRISWNGRMERNEHGNFLGMSSPYITLYRGTVNSMYSLVSIEETFELQIDPNHAWSNLRHHIRELLEQRHIEHLRSLSEDEIGNLPIEDLELLAQERANG
jgi:hypothetical protein